MKLAIALAVTALLASTTTQADATLAITYDGSNRPTSVSGLPVSVAPFMVDIIIDYSGLSFNSQYDALQPPGGSPGGLTWGNSVLASSVGNALALAMNTDPTPLPSISTDVSFTIATTTTNVYSTVVVDRFAPDEWTSLPGNESNRAVARPINGWATVSAVPEPSAFLCVGLGGLGFAGWKRRTANRDPS